MILGLGSDLCDIRRIERAIGRHGSRFLERCFTATERARAERRAGILRAATYAKRWAAKEACAKALGTGFAQGVFHSDMGVVNLPGGQPTLCLTGGALVRLRQLMPPGHRPSLLLTLTDEPPYAFAQVLIQAAAEGADRARPIAHERGTGEGFAMDVPVPDLPAPGGPHRGEAAAGALPPGHRSGPGGA